MPHIILEYSENIDQNLIGDLFFQQIHQLLEAELPTELSSCKSRCIVSHLFYIGDGHLNNAFAHLTIKILAGRSDEKKTQLGNKILSLMQQFFQQYQIRLNLQLSIEILDLDQHYFKSPRTGA